MSAHQVFALVRSCEQVDHAVIERDYLEALADKDASWIGMMLEKTKLLEQIAAKVFDATRRFKAGQASSKMRDKRPSGETTPGTTPRDPPESKFFEDGDAALAYGSTEVLMWAWWWVFPKLPGAMRESAWRAARSVGHSR